MRLDEFFVTFSITTIATAIFAGLAFGLVIVRQSVEYVLRRFLNNGRLEAIIDLLPGIFLLVGIPVSVAFYASQIIVDVLTGSPNIWERAAGRGVANLVFVICIGIGTWISVKWSRRA